MSDATPAIEAVDLVKRFGDFTAVDGVSFTVPEGSVFSMLGPNGAGKTTTVRMMTTLSRPTSGTARVAGYDVVADADAVRHRMGLTAQSATVDELLTGRENLRLVGDLYGLPRPLVRRVADELLERFSLSEAADKVVKDLLRRDAPPPRPRGEPRGHARPCSSSTSPPRASTRAAASSCGTCCATSCARAPRSSSRRSTSTRPTSSPTGSSSSTTARSSPTARRSSSRTSPGGQPRHRR